MKVLVFCTGYYPEATGAGPFNTDLCTYLVEQGHEVTAVVGFPHFPEWKKAEAYRGVHFQRETHHGVQLIRVPMYVPAYPTPLHRIAYDSSYFVSALIAGGLFGGAPDVMLAVCTPLQAGAVAMLLGFARRRPFVFHLQDLLPESAVALGMLRQGAAIKAARTLASIIYARSTRISVIGHAFIDALERTGVPAEKLVYLPNWVDTDWVRPLPRMNDFRRQVGAGEDDFVVEYVGNFGFKQQMETVVEAARRLAGQRQIKFVLVGDGSRKQAAVDAAHEANLDNVAFLGVQGRARLPEMLAASDLLVLHQRTEVVDMVVPSKLLTYAAAGRPILLAGVPESEGAKFVADADAGLVIPPEDPEAFAAAIVSLQADAAGRERMGMNGRQYVEANFNRERVLTRAETLLVEVAHRRLQPAPALSS